MTALDPGTDARAARWDSVDDYLGPAATRFFGEGYRRTGPRLRDVVITHEPGSSRLSGTGGLTLPDTWSVKGGAHQRPHLATTDAIVLTAQAVGAVLAARPTTDAAGGALVTELEIRAGRRPLEEALDGFPVTASVDALGAGAPTQRFSAAIGPMAASGTIATTQAAPGALAEASGATHSVRLTGLELGAGSITAGCDLVADAPHPAATGPWSTPAYSLVHVFVAALQLGQVLLYEADGLTRSTSSTLWMRRTWARTTGPLHAGAPVPVEARLQRSRLVRRDGAVWRLADVTARLGPYELECSVAHDVSGGVP